MVRLCAIGIKSLWLSVVVVKLEINVHATGWNWHTVWCMVYGV